MKGNKGKKLIVDFNLQQFPDLQLKFAKLFASTYENSHKILDDDSLKKKS